MRRAQKPITFPCLQTRMVPATQVVANDYNPNTVASPEMELLAVSIEEDGVTQPVVTYYDAEIQRYIVVDGFHRFTILTRWFQLDQIPVVVIDKSIGERMASTVRHNRARGKHKVDMMAVLLEKLIKLGRTDLEIADALGMEAEEVIRLKQMTGLAGLFKGQGYSRAWVRPEGATEEGSHELCLAEDI